MGNKTLNLRGRLLSLTQPCVMGILNITDDSFYAGSRVASEKEWLLKAEKMLADGAAILDIGAYSSRPGAPDIAEEIESERIRKALASITKEFPEANISVDTFRSQVAKMAVSEGAALINDISGGALDKNMFAAIAELKVPYILMHMRGNPQNMNSLTNYNNLVKDITDYFHDKIAQLTNLGVKDVVLDPGIGFAKTVDQNFSLLNNLEQLRILDKALLVGVSRKSLVWKTLEVTADDALNGTTALHSWALSKGASILRVHDVKEANEVVKLFVKMKQSV